MHTIETQISEEIAHDVPASLDPQLVERAAQAALEATSAPDDLEITILLTGDQQIQELNRQFLDVDAPTDVLSFPADYCDPDTETK